MPIIFSLLAERFARPGFHPALEAIEERLENTG
jgi:hypothetical protein